MVAKKSLLRAEEVPQFLLRNYGIEVDGVVEIDRGILSKTYKVTSENEQYFLKEPLNTISGEGVEREAYLLEHLSKKQIPVAEFVHTLEGKHFVDHGENLVFLQKYIEGDKYKIYHAPDELYLPSMEFLGKFNASLVDYELSLRRKWSREYCATYDEQKVIKRLKKYSKHVKKLNLETGEVKRALGTIRYVKQIQPLMKEYGSYFEYISYGNSHGDYHVENLIYQDAEIAAVVDCASSSVRPIVFNLMRFYLRFDRDCRGATHVNLSKLAKGVQAYTTHSPLTYYDYRFMPYVYLHIVGRIILPFKIKKYVAHNRIGDSDSAYSKLGGILWLIKMHRYVMNNAESISKYLVKQYEKTLSGEQLKQHKQLKRQFEKQDDMKRLREQEKAIASRRIVRNLLPAPVKKFIKKVLPERLRKTLMS